LDWTALTAADYLAWEAEQDHKHEFLAGEVFAMAGAGDAHVTISGNLFASLRSHLLGQRCGLAEFQARATVACRCPVAFDSGQ